MITAAYLQDLFSLIDRQDAAAFTQSFAAEGVFRFGNHPPLHGAAAIEPVVAGFFSSLAGLAHQVDEIWPLAEATLCHGRVTYTRADGRDLKVPFAVIVKGEAGAIAEYLIFVDNSALAAPTDDA